MKIILLGSGHVAFHFKKVLEHHPTIQIVQWYSRSFSEIESKTKIPKTGNLENLKAADLYLIAVSDKAIPEVSSHIPNAGFAVHTAGGMPLDSLKNDGPKGVFYPVQSFSKKRDIDFSKIPVCIESDTQKGITLLEQFGEKLKTPLHHTESAQRLVLHIAAVFANNFANHCYVQAEKVCSQNGIPFDLLRPLISETVNKIYTISPLEAQTGPAVRNDMESINNHLNQLKSKHQKELYSFLTQSIQYHGKNEL